MLNVLPFWLTYEEATFEPKSLGFDTFHSFNGSSVATGLGCPFCGQGIYREYEGQVFITCDNHHLKQAVERTVSGPWDFPLVTEFSEALTSEAISDKQNT
jgi:hypothetical protein